MSIQAITHGAGGFTGNVLQAAGTPSTTASSTRLAGETGAPIVNGPASMAKTSADDPGADAPNQAGSEQVQTALEEVREALAPVARNLQFSLDEDTGRTVIKIIDSSTDEVIRQIPSEEIIAIAKALDKLQGLLLRQEA